MDNKIRLIEGMGVKNPTVEEAKFIVVAADLRNVRVHDWSRREIADGNGDCEISFNRNKIERCNAKLPVTFTEFIQAILNEPEKVKESFITVNLNEDYSAIVSKNGIKVGCQTFPLSVIDSLAAAKKKVEG